MTQAKSPRPTKTFLPYHKIARTIHLMKKRRTTIHSATDPSGCAGVTEITALQACKPGVGSLRRGRAPNSAGSPGPCPMVALGRVGNGGCKNKMGKPNGEYVPIVCIFPS